MDSEILTIQELAAFLKTKEKLSFARPPRAKHEIWVSWELAVLLNRQQIMDQRAEREC